MMPLQWRGILPFGVSGATASLCLAAITHTYLLFHCAPYVGYMSTMLPHQLHGRVARNVSVDSVGWYAGLLGTAFTTGRCLSFVPWKIYRHSSSAGNSSSLAGVKNSLLLSLGLSAVCSLWFGLSRTYTSALLARFALGLSNTLSGCVKRAAIDRGKQLREQHNTNAAIASREEELAPARVLAVMWWGSALGPCLGGVLSTPGFTSLSEDLPQWIELYPFLLPNLVAAALCLISMAGVYHYIEVEIEQQEPTNPPNPPPGNPKTDEEGVEQAESSPLLNKKKPATERTTATGTAATIDTTQQKETIHALRNIWKSRNARFHLIAYWAFSFVVVAIDEALPLYLIARLSGPGLSPNQIGWILSAAGMMVVLSQNLTAKHIFSEAGGLSFYRNIRFSALLGSVPSVLVPLVLILNGGTYYDLLLLVGSSSTEEQSGELLPGAAGGEALGPPGSLKWTSFLFLFLLAGSLKVFDSIYFALIGVATGRTVPPCHRDEVARIMTLGALIARAIAPVVAGALVSIFMSDSIVSWSHHGDSVVLWTVIGLVFGAGAAIFSFQLYEQADRNTDNDNDERQSQRSQRQSLYLDNRQRAQVYVKLWEIHYDQGSSTVGAKWRRLARKAITLNRMKGALSPTNKKSDDDDHDPEAAAEVVSKKKHNKRTSWVDHVLKPGIDIENTPFFILGTHKNDKSCLPHVATPPLMEALRQHLPMSCSEDNFWLKYSMVRDGASTQVLATKLLMVKNTFVAIETLDGDVFGCFMTRPWERTSKFEHDGESFLWRMKHRHSTTPATAPLDEDALNEIARKEGDIEIYRWTGENDECQLLSHDRIAAGSGMVEGPGQQDGFGFIIQDGLSQGSSSPCITYGNPCLVSSEDDGRFEVANMEVWAMTPFLFAEEAEKSISTVRFLKENLNVHGDKPSSAQSAWTTFL
ncbi:Oxidation resistance protein 1 [Seminavis robusta]|uniref:Oxidation resistance protein 1 n=1 Tax=Seminavis robusta TaxID=568900 RepID=A0A9N8E6H1_9STRA|nr:Oxidation resistance protein 1 [Seminavis robusta]|eukprot:Sro723_g193010.1 Oxidation resistance protein 1 (925) ;mRNA; f:27531-30729